MSTLKLTTESIRVNIEDDGTSPYVSTFVPVNASIGTETMTLHVYFCKVEGSGEVEIQTVDMKKELIKKLLGFDVVMGSATDKWIVHSGEKYTNIRDDDDSVCYGVQIKLDEIASYRSKCGHVTFSFVLGVTDDALSAIVDVNRQATIISSWDYAEDVFKPPIECHHCSDHELALRFKGEHRQYHMNLFTGPPFEDYPGTNFTIRLCDDQQFHVHRSVLMSEAGAWKAMLTMDTEENRNGVLQLEDIDGDSMHLFLEVLYDRSKYLDHCMDYSALMKIHRIADRYQVKDVSNLCKKALLMVPIKREYFFDCLGHAYDLNFKELVQRCGKAAISIGPDLWKDQVLDLNRKNLDMTVGLLREVTALAKEKLDEGSSHEAEAAAPSPANDDE